MEKQKKIHLFGSKTNCGEYFFRKSRKSFEVLRYSRNFDSEYIKVDFKNNTNQRIFFESSYCVSFMPIWTFSELLNKKYKNDQDELKNIELLIVCSSSSAETKKYTSNKFDRNLYQLLTQSENLIRKICNNLNIKLLIIRPSLIYGNLDLYRDKNINVIINILKILPFIFLPTNTGLRQPIHFSQLSDFILDCCLNPEKIGLVSNHNVISIGGDYEISYHDLLVLIRKELVIDNNLNYFLIFKIPNRIFNFILSPLALVSPKIYDAVTRISIDLAGFKKSSELLNCKKKSFKFYD